MNQIREIIFDFVMNKIYDKIFPVELNRKDNKIYQNSIRLSWVQPYHFLGNKKQYVLGSFINDINHDFKLLLSEKSINKISFFKNSMIIIILELMIHYV